jgi:hypothetical protein
MPEIQSVSCKPRKYNTKFEFAYSRHPVMAKTKMASEKILMKSMTETGKPYRTPEQLSNEIHERVR